MAKAVNVTYLDALFNYIKNSADTIGLSLCAGQPTTRTQADSTNALAKTTLNKATELTLANGDVSGRKMTVSAKTGVAVTVSGSGDHVAIYDATNVLVVTTCSSVAVTNGGTVDIGSFKEEVPQPT